MTNLIDVDFDRRCAEYVRPAPSTASIAARERPVPTGCRVVDVAIEGASPGGLTVFTTTDPQMRAAAAVDLARRFRDEGPQRVLLATSASDARALADHVDAVSRGLSLAHAAAGCLPRNRSERARPEIVVAPDVRDASVAAARLREMGGPVGLVIALDADCGGRLGGETVLEGWRELARRTGALVVVFVSGTAPSWAHACDAHVDLFRTQTGRFRRFIARGVPPLSSAGPRFAVALDADLGTVHVLDRGALIYRSRGTTWAPERDFEGTTRARPTVMLPGELRARLTDPQWAPTAAREAILVLEALAAAVVDEQDEVGIREMNRDDLRSVIRRCAAACGRAADEAWGRALQFMRADGSQHPFSAGRALELSPRMFAEDETPEGDSVAGAPGGGRYDVEALRRAMRAGPSDDASAPIPVAVEGNLEAIPQPDVDAAADAYRQARLHGACGKTGDAFAPVLRHLRGLGAEGDDRGIDRAVLDRATRPSTSAIEDEPDGRGRP